MIIIRVMPDSQRHDTPALLRDALPGARASTLDDAVTSRELLKGGRELRIQHGDEVYRLCHTRNDKLILIK